MHLGALRSITSAIDHCPSCCSYKSSIDCTPNYTTSNYIKSSPLTVLKQLLIQLAGNVHIATCKSLLTRRESSVHKGGQRPRLRCCRHEFVEILPRGTALQIQNYHHMSCSATGNANKADGMCHTSRSTFRCTDIQQQSHCSPADQQSSGARRTAPPMQCHLHRLAAAVPALSAAPHSAGHRLPYLSGLHRAWPPQNGRVKDRPRSSSWRWRGAAHERAAEPQLWRQRLQLKAQEQAAVLQPMPAAALLQAR